jgi:hypothetical protein
MDWTTLGNLGKVLRERKRERVIIFGSLCESSGTEYSTVSA